MIVLLCGLTGSGRRTVADMFVKHGYTHLRISSIVESTVCGIFNYSPDKLKERRDLVEPDLCVSPQHMIEQLLSCDGNSSGSELNTFWVRVFARRYADKLYHKQLIVISDLRTVAELDYLYWGCQDDVFVFTVFRETPYCRSYMNMPAIDPFDNDNQQIDLPDHRVIYNNKTLEALEESVQEITKELQDGSFRCDKQEFVEHLKSIVKSYSNR